MKLSMTLCATFVALAAFTLTAQGASATPQFSVNTSRFDPYKLKANDPNGETDCTAKGGKSYPNADGSKTCKDVQDNALADTGKTVKPNSLDKTPPPPPAPVEATAVRENAVAETGKCPKDKASATGGAGDGKAGVTARTDSQRGVWKAPAGIESKTAKATGDSKETPISDKTAGDSTGGPRIGSPWNDCANIAVPVPTEQNQ